MALINRKAARGVLKTIMENTGAFSAVYDYAPSLSTIGGRGTICIIRSAGTRQTFESLHKNPADIQLTILVVVPYDRDVSKADIEDKLDDLDLVVRQAIRDNVDSFGVNAVMRITEAYSVAGYDPLGGETMRMEERDVFIFYPCGE